MSTPREGQQTPSAAPSTPVAPRPHDGMEEYHRIADTIGGVPNLRWKDNVFQMLCVGLLTAVGGLLGWQFLPSKDIDTAPRVILGVIAGLVVGTLLSGFVLMVLGWIRSGKKR